MRIKFYCDVPIGYTMREVERFGLHARTKPAMQRDKSIRISLDVNLPENIVRGYDFKVDAGGITVEDERSKDV